MASLCKFFIISCTYRCMYYIYIPLFIYISFFCVGWFSVCQLQWLLLARHKLQVTPTSPRQDFYSFFNCHYLTLPIQNWWSLPLDCNDKPYCFASSHNLYLNPLPTLWQPMSILSQLSLQRQHLMTFIFQVSFYLSYHKKLLLFFPL